MMHKILASFLVLFLAPALFAADAGLLDAGLLDAGLSDAGLSDAGLSDAGLSDAGFEEPCSERCDGNVLNFCDQNLSVQLDCETLSARCGTLSPEWGLDCLLPAAAACAPGYAQGLSRCDAARGLICNAGICERCTSGGSVESADGGVEEILCESIYAEPPALPSRSGADVTPVAAEDNNIFGCLNTDGLFGGALFLMGFWRLRRRGEREA